MTGDLGLAGVRVARPTDRLGEVVRFYEEGLGLPRVGEFAGHAGYSGVMLGLPGRELHLEFTEHEAGSPCPAPTADNLLVLYLHSAEDVERMAARLAVLGREPVPPENPFWAEDRTYEDPDGWRVVLVDSSAS